jgi:hypothetical protein
VKEAELQREVRLLAAEYGIHAVHLTDARTGIGTSGMPDWIFLGSRLLWRELKSAGEDLRSSQTRWKHMLLAAMQDWDVWRPADLESGRIAQELQAIAPAWAVP